ncbi:diacylglycerol acyltransferase [Thamnocephalis sphaerospora]|uniref:Diacylglycerol O-acyltransferase n=1 Tax=Thamnocephalis sphaerospora TaxID=78915 RepID=A0A4P9XW11_9FUNG|nr:diacylglycerol acyltransferase [Thamnocephalis sphaerospora]|eukprot:RKP10232.1 diacylglycerol acyltransferase [Thamnocephalis sphaerospora]
MAIQLAPLNVPRKRRLQTLAVLLWISLVPICVSIFIYCCWRVSLWPFVTAYCTYLYFDVAPDHGARKVEWIRRLVIWRWFVQYFPIRLHKEVDLDPDRNYIFGYHPHGIIGMGAFSNFGTEANDISKVLPGINIRLLTLASNFSIPLYRDVLLSLNLGSVSRKSITRILEKGPGHSCMIVIGGATESLSARPGINDLVLKRRLGFIKLAIRSGADLVPVFSFGENDIYDQLDNAEGTTVRMLQTRFQSIFGFTTPLFHGRGIFNYNMGIMPHRRPIHTIIGRAVRVQQCDEPTMEQVLEVQERYINALVSIYDKYKDQYAKDRIRDLRIIE